MSKWSQVRRGERMIYSHEDGSGIVEMIHTGECYLLDPLGRPIGEPVVGVFAVTRSKLRLRQLRRNGGGTVRTDRAQY